MWWGFGGAYGKMPGIHLQDRLIAPPLCRRTGGIQEPLALEQTTSGHAGKGQAPGTLASFGPCPRLTRCLTLKGTENNGAVPCHAVPAQPADTWTEPSETRVPL